MTDEKVAKLQGGPADGDDAKRGRSTIEFPYLDLEDAVEITTSVHQIGGSGCEWDQLAAHLKQAAKGGGFRLRMITAKAFGLLNYDRGTVTLTPLGMRVSDAHQSKRAKVDAFLSVALYKRIYDKFRGVSLPPPAGLEREMETLGVAPKQKEKARQVFQRSAKYAGFFDFAPDRLVLPSGTGSTQNEGKPDEARKPPTKPGGGGGGDDGGLNLDPLLMALLRKIPEGGPGQWPAENRVRWFRTFAMNVSQVYDEDAAPVELEIKIKDQA